MVCGKTKSTNLQSFWILTYTKVREKENQTGILLENRKKNFWVAKIWNRSRVSLAPAIKSESPYNSIVHLVTCTMSKKIEPHWTCFICDTISTFFMLTKLFSKEIIIFFLLCRVGHLDKRPLVQTWNYAKDKLSFSREMNLGAFYNLAQIFIYGQWNSSLKGKILIVSKVNLFPTTVYVFLSSQ